MEINKIRQIEEAGMNSWPAHQQLLYDGWLLRFADGYTKRANSVMPIYATILDFDEKISYCESVYHQMELPAVFRLTPLAGDTLDQTLLEHGYQKLHPTRVLTMPLEGWNNPAQEQHSIRLLPLDQWMGVFSKISGSLVEKQPAHNQILRNILNPHITAAVEISGTWVACGLGVLERDWFGLFDIVTHPDYRQRGYATQLITEMLAWAKLQGAKETYLQVMENNASALRLYAKLGYIDAYGYWYRVPAEWGLE